MTDGLIFRTIPLAFVAAFVLLAAASSAHAADALNVYPAPKGAALNESFAVKVHTPGGAWQDVAVCDGPKDSLLEDKGPDRMIQGVVFEGLKINDKPVLKAEDGANTIGTFVTGVEFK